jgi:hypothetical protein
VAAAAAAALALPAATGLCEAGKLRAGLTAGAVLVAVAVVVLGAVLQLCTLVPVAAAGTGEALCFLGEACRGGRLAAAAAAAAVDEATCTARALPAAVALAAVLPLLLVPALDEGLELLLEAALPLSVAEAGVGSFVVRVLIAVARERASRDGVFVVLLLSATSTTTISGVLFLALLLLLLLEVRAATELGLLDDCCRGFSAAAAFLGFEADAATAELGLL